MRVLLSIMKYESTQQIMKWCNMCKLQHTIVGTQLAMLLPFQNHLPDILCDCTVVITNRLWYRFFFWLSDEALQPLVPVTTFASLPPTVGWVEQVCIPKQTYHI